MNILNLLHWHGLRRVDLFPSLHEGLCTVHFVSKTSISLQFDTEMQNEEFCRIISGSDAVLNLVCFLCHNYILRRQWESGLQDKVTLPGCLSWRKWTARTKQFRILLSFKLEHIEGLLTDWWNNGRHLSRSHRPFISHSCLISAAYIIILP